LAKNSYFNLVSLGCPKNRVDAERILAVMSRAGFVFTDTPAEADVIIINTCAFIEAAVDESVDTILDHIADNPRARIVVSGCLPLRYRESLREVLPEVTLFLTPDRIAALPGLLKTPSRRRASQAPPSIPLAADGRILTTPGYAYLKIAEGCSRACRYCTIPSIRGSLRSEDPVGLEEEASALVAMGARELVLVAQDLTAYGHDRGEMRGLVTLLKRLDQLPGLAWIRLLYLHPNGIPTDLGRVINESPRILPYLDIPFQHVSEKVLRAMGRPWKKDHLRRLVDRLRDQIANLVLRTTLMVGYPAEGEKEFEELRDFVQEMLIERVGVFAYSPEEGTRSWNLGDPVPPDVKEERAAEIRAIHLRFMVERNRQRIGSVEECLVEGFSTESDLLLQGRCWDQAPDIDGVLYITAGEATAGELHRVKITEAHEWDLFGEIEPLDEVPGQ
jgi:ribosomal protein S12 methylthiotransferase